MPLHTKNAIQQMASSYCSKSDVGSSSKLILLQSKFGYQQRQEATSVKSDADIYQRAGVRTPSQNVARDVNGSVLFLQHIVKELSLKNKMTLFVQTTRSTVCSITNNMLQNDADTVEILNLCSDPLQWDSETRNDIDGCDSSVSLENLESLACRIESSAASSAGGITVVVESLTPLILWHGFVLTVKWLRRVLLSKNVVVVLPINTNSLTLRQTLALQDLCNACLFLQDGEATLIRQGGGWDTNVIRTKVPYDIVLQKVSGGGNSCNMTLQVGVESSSSHQDEGLEQKEPSTATNTQSASLQDSMPSGKGLGRKVVLQHQDDDLSDRPPPTTTAAAIPKRPQIYIQDNDPEYDDLDEEDPDDDLDI